ncbi:uncharacterized protein AKAME5_000198300 [Lates japonicus]|uniref:Uncharacterized protein n=1 Tax=Lates japonicus TaxID=270547 RepID=A0AAD3QY60_LATJO|nr:uncharacterized protein AKAME5_000198300 [Lates japonicus]
MTYRTGVERRRPISDPLASNSSGGSYREIPLITDHLHSEGKERSKPTMNLLSYVQWPRIRRRIASCFGWEASSSVAGWTRPNYLRRKLFFLFIVVSSASLATSCENHPDIQFNPSVMSLRLTAPSDLRDHHPLNNTQALHSIPAYTWTTRVDMAWMPALLAYLETPSSPFTVILLYGLLIKYNNSSAILPARRFGFPPSTDVICQIPQSCNASHVTLKTQPESETESNQIWLPIRNKKTDEEGEKELQFDFTVHLKPCLEATTMLLQFCTNPGDIYRLNRLLRATAETVEMVPWPIGGTWPSQAWLFSEAG